MSVTALTPAAQRLLDALPDYYWGNRIILRIVQAWGNEIDRVDGKLDALKNGLVPSMADNTLGLLALWARIMRVPIPAGATVQQVQQALVAAWRVRAASSAREFVAAMGSGITILRDTPAVLHDTLQIGFPADSLQGSQIAARAEQMWPAHRELHLEFSTGFLLDRSELDRDEF